MGTEVAHKLLDFSQDLDVSLLDATVTRFYAGSNEEVRPLHAADCFGPFYQARAPSQLCAAGRHHVPDVTITSACASTCSTEPA